MGFIDKVKGFFYDEEEIEEEVEVPVKRELPKKKPIILDKEEEKKEISERELFRAERTFNFPMDMDEEDEPDFMPIKKSIKEEKNSSNVVENKKVSYSSNTSTVSSYKSYSPVKTKEKQEKKFKPTPIISPIYGIIEGQYENSNKKDTLLSETKEFSITKKIDFDTVREKAYGKVKNDYTEDSETNEENKGIFFNLVDDETDDKNEVVTENKIEADEEDDIKITYNDVDYDEETDDDIEVPKITRIKKNKNIMTETKEQDEDAILSETKEQDLFNLIDNMYNSEEEDEE